MKRDYDYDHLIDSFPMLVPDIDIEITYEETDVGKFDEAGHYHRMVERFDRRKWRFKYAILTKEEFVYLRSLFKEKQDFLFSFLNESNEVEIVRAYCKLVSATYRSKRSGLYKNLTLEIVEC